MYQLATIQLNLREGARDVGLFAADVLDWEQDNQGGSVVRFRDGRAPMKVTESVTAIQTAINALWDQYADRANTSVAGADYTVTNLTTDRALDADATTLAEVADVLGTLISDLTTAGIIQ